MLLSRIIFHFVSSVKYIRIYLAILLLIAAAYTGWDMVRRTEAEMLWGWRPFFLLAAGWSAVLMLIWHRFRHDPEVQRNLALSTAAGILLSLGFPPSIGTPLILIGLVPLLMVEDRIRSAQGGTARWRVFRYAFNTFFIWNFGTTWWVINTSFLPGIITNSTNGALMAAVFVIYHQARHVLPRRLHPITLVSFWIAFEYLHMFWDISWPWLTFGNAMATRPEWVQWYEFTGVFGGSLWILLANYWIWRAMRRKPFYRYLHIWFGIALWIAGPVAWSIGRYSAYPVPGGTIEIAVVQPNFEPHYQKFALSQRQQLERFLTLSRDVLTPQTEYLVFPETSFGLVHLNMLEADYRIMALRELLAEFPRLKIVSGLESYRTHPGHISDMPSLREFIRGPGDTLWLDVQNSALYLMHNRPPELYFKSKLVPGAEFFPFRNIMPFIKPIIDMLQGSIEGLTMQDDRSVFHSVLTGVAPIICYESVFGAYVGGYVRNGAGILMIITNDGWWDRTPGHVQHLQIGALRAIEHRRPIARSANTGISCFINERGDILQATNYDEPIAILSSLAPGSKTTFYTQWGDMIARVCVFLAIMFVALVVTRGMLKERN